MRHKLVSCKESRWDQGACLVPKGVGPDSGFLKGCPTEDGRPVEVASSPFGMDPPGLVLLAGTSLTSNPLLAAPLSLLFTSEHLF